VLADSARKSGLETSHFTDSETKCLKEFGEVPTIRLQIGLLIAPFYDIQPSQRRLK